MAGKRNALITGASNGIGLEFARVSARHGYHLVLVARDEGKLKDVAATLAKEHNITAITIAVDLTKADAPETIYRKTDELDIAVELLVNNAGFAEYGSFADSELQRQLNMVALNITSLTHLTHLYLQPMKRRRCGRIVNVASTAAFQPGPLMAVYYASKAYVLSFSEALRNEVGCYNIEVTALCPGPTRTDFFHKQPKMLDSRLLKRGGNLMRPQTVAEAGYHAVMRGEAVVIPGFWNKCLAFLSRIAPRSLVVKVSRWTLELK